MSRGKNVMKNYPTRKSRAGKNPRRQPLSTFEEMVREEFRKPLDVALEQFAAAVLPEPLDPSKSWVGKIRSLWSKEPDGFLLVDVSLALDRVFGCPYGYFLTLWATRAARSRAKKRRAWLAMVQPLPVEQRLAAWRAPEGRGADAAVSTHQCHYRMWKTLRSKRRNQRPAVTGESSTAATSSHGRNDPKGHRA